jgi:parallel beta-helix repeat protein
LRIRGGTLSTTTPITHHWSNTDISYAVTSFTTIANGVTLVIDPDVTVKFDNNILLGVHGVLKVQGTITEPVHITSIKDDTVGGDTNGDGSASAPSAGDWGHIVFFDDSVDSENLIEHAVIRYGGFFENGSDDYYSCWYCTYYDAVRFISASPTIRYNTFDQNRGYALSASIDSFPVVHNNTLIGNEGNGLRIRGGTLSTTTPITHHWSNTDLSYAVTSFTTIANGVTLVIDPDVTVKFDNNILLGVHGVLKVQGTITEPVHITSIKDDTVGGDTNGDGSASAPSAGDWGHIVFFDDSVDSENLIEHAVIRYGGFFENGSDDYYSCWYCTYYAAVRFRSASPTIRYNTVTQNNHGLRTTNGSSPTIYNNEIYNNDNFGIYNDDTSITIIAENNWWGDSTGPYHPTLNPGGQGDNASDYVDFSPWLTSLP